MHSATHHRSTNNDIKMSNDAQIAHSASLDRPNKYSRLANVLTVNPQSPPCVKIVSVSLLKIIDNFTQCWSSRPLRVNHLQLLRKNLQTKCKALAE